MTVAWRPPAERRFHAPADIWNALVNRLDAPIALAGKNVSATAGLIPTPSLVPVAALVEAGPLRLVAAFDSFPFAQLFEAALDCADLPVLPIPLRDALIEGMVASVWALLPDKKIPAYSILGLGEWRADTERTDPALTWLSVQITGASQQPIQIRIGCDATRAAQFIGDGLLAPKRAEGYLRGALSLEASCLVGWMRISLAAAQALQAGDVILIGVDQRDRVFIRLPNELHIFGVTDAGWVHAGTIDERARGEAMANEVEENLSGEGELSQGAPALSDLPVDIDLELTRLRIKLGEIETWRPGAVVILDGVDPLDGMEVTIRANGVALAKGDLVQIDDRLAVRISTILKTA